MSVMIEKALAASSKTVPVGNLEALQAERTRISKVTGSLLAVEKQAKQQLANRWNEIEAEIALLQTAELFPGMARLDPDVFSWTKPQRVWKRRGRAVTLDVPTFAYIDVTEDECQLHREQPSWTNTSLMPGYVRTRYEKTLKAMDISGHRSVTLTYRYSGVIPTDVREIIQREQLAQRFNNLALVCDVPAWTVKSVPEPPRELLDPILVGVRANTLWVLAAFDPTPVETYMVDEFTAKETDA